MNRLKQLIRAATLRVSPQSVRVVPLMVPHGGGGASSDFESAFEMLPGDDSARELWHRERIKIPFGRAT